MSRVVTPKVVMHATHETVALPVRGVANLRVSVIYDHWLATWETALAALAPCFVPRAPAPPNE